MGRLVFLLAVLAGVYWYWSGPYQDSRPGGLEDQLQENARIMKKCIQRERSITAGAGMVGADAGATWNDEPYRGLETFGIEHAEIFYGREEETFELALRLRDQRQAGCAFVVIVGASGSGKSSVARAGVAAARCSAAAMTSASCFGADGWISRRFTRCAAPP